MSDIRPGLNIEFFDHADYVNDKIRVMRSMIFDATAKKLTIAQTSPPLLRSHIKKHIVVTYLVKKEGKPARLGFPAKILDLIEGFRLSSGERVPAILIEREAPSTAFNIRFSYRLKVPSMSGLTLHIRGERANLLDISIGGAMISGVLVYALEPNSRVRVRVGFDGQVFHLDAEVLRIWSPGPDGRRTVVRIAALKFINVPMALEGALSKKLFEIERQLLAKEGN